MTQVTVILLALNEASHILPLLNQLVRTDGLDKEIIVADGGSTDGTIKLVQAFALEHPSVKLVHNHEKYVSFALNLTIPQAKGTYIAVFGAHTGYPDDYLSTAVKFLDTHPDYMMVGGPIRCIARSGTGKTIAACMNSVFGMGNSAFRMATQDRDVETVPFPVYRKPLFDILGGYDPELIRTQDSDFHYRAIRAGYKIRLLTNLQTQYYTRENLRDLFHQFFDYGYYKALALSKPHYRIKLRHLIPAFFTSYLTVLVFAFLYTESWFAIAWPAGFYLILGAYFSAKTWQCISRFCMQMIVFPLMHLSYGSGMLFGFAKQIAQKSDR